MCYLNLFCILERSLHIQVCLSLTLKPGYSTNYGPNTFGQGLPQDYQNTIGLNKYNRWEISLVLILFCLKEGKGYHGLFHRIN